ncbi:hypothetical protein FACS189499_10220 [Clostridia bacterium]|nr:hypothetical protein FACS189499_10220 [Clostridia bacterium]
MNFWKNNFFRRFFMPHTHAYFLKTRDVQKCAKYEFQVSPTAGTIFTNINGIQRQKGGADVQQRP